MGAETPLVTVQVESYDGHEARVRYRLPEEKEQVQEFLPQARERFKSLREATSRGDLVVCIVTVWCQGWDWVDSGCIGVVSCGLCSLQHAESQRN